MTKLMQITLLVLLITAACGVLTGAMFISIQEHVINERTEALLTPVRISQCQQFFLDGTDNWINCMGVGKK